MNKIVLFSFALILFISCNNGVTMDNLCLYSESSVYIGAKEISKPKSESIVVDRKNNELWYIRHNERMILMRNLYETNDCIELNFKEGKLNYLYEDYMFNGKLISRAIIQDTQELVIFDIYKNIYNIIRIDIPQSYRICGLDNNYIYLYIQNNLISKINYLTFEEEKIELDIYNPGYCVEAESFIGITEKNNICIIKDGVRDELPIKGIRYNRNTKYVDISNLYYCTGNNVYYAKKDTLGYIKGIFNLTFFMDGLGPIKWYCYDMKENKSIKINNKGYSFLCE